MRLIIAALLCFGLIASQADAQKKGTSKKEAEIKMEVKTKEQKLAYSIGRSIGMNMANQIKGDSVNLNLDYFSYGFREGVFGKDPLIPDTEIQQILNEFQIELQAKHAAMEAKQKEEMKKVAEKYQKEGESFFEANKKREGVITLPSGLQYKVIVEGTGPIPTATDTVTTHYRGTLIDGKEFDNSYKRGQPITFPVGGVIPGWVEALQLMKVGSKWQLFIPGNLAYGERGAGEIPPNATLIFDIELISISGKK